MHHDEHPARVVLRSPRALEMHPAVGALERRLAHEHAVLFVGVRREGPRRAFLEGATPGEQRERADRRDSLVHPEAPLPFEGDAPAASVVWAGGKDGKGRRSREGQRRTKSGPRRTAHRGRARGDRALLRIRDRRDARRARHREPRLRRARRAVANLRVRRAFARRPPRVVLRRQTHRGGRADRRARRGRGARVRAGHGGREPGARRYRAPRNEGARRAPHARVRAGRAALRELLVHVCPGRGGDPRRGSGDDELVAGPHVPRPVSRGEARRGRARRGLEARDHRGGRARADRPRAPAGASLRRRRARPCGRALHDRGRHALCAGAVRRHRAPREERSRRDPGRGDFAHRPRPPAGRRRARARGRRDGPHARASFRGRDGAASRELFAAIAHGGRGRAGSARPPTRSPRSPRTWVTTTSAHFVAHSRKTWGTAPRITGARRRPRIRGTGGARRRNGGRPRLTRSRAKDDIASPSCRPRIPRAPRAAYGPLSPCARRRRSPRARPAKAPSTSRAARPSSP